MDDNQLKDRQDVRWLVGFMSFCLLLAIVIVLLILLAYGQGGVILELLKIGGPLVGGLLGGYGIGRATK